MRILLSIHSLAGRGGTETYTVTVADHLQRLGHDVHVATPALGRGSDLAADVGVRVVRSASDLDAPPDVVIPQDAAAAYEAAAVLPGVPQLYVAHSDTFDLQLPPQLAGIVSAVAVLCDRVERRVRALALVPPIVRLTQPIDVEVFKPMRALPPRARTALTLGNYVHGERSEMLRRACERAGIELRHLGRHGAGETEAPQQAYDAADIVFGKARVIFEAMACGRAAYVLDHNGAEGWVTSANRERLAADNFGGQSEPLDLDEDRLALDLERYDPAMGLGNRDFVVARNAATAHAAALVDVLRGLAPGQSPTGPLDELARMVRLHHRADGQAFALRTEVADRQARIAELEQRSAQDAERFAVDARRAEEDRAAAGQRVAEAQRRALEAQASATRHALLAAGDRAWAQEAQRRLAGVVNSHRWRLTQVLMRPLDRVRGRGSETTAHAGPPPPAPFIVGVPRSGTTLLRLLLDAHPDLAIPPETGFGLAVATAPAGPAELAAALQALETWPDLRFELDELTELLATVKPWSTTGGLRAIYGAYAGRHGKPRWGDKTPVHLQYMDELAGVFPEARFVHLIRDGRDVAASLRGLPFAPGDGSPEAIAGLWRAQIAAARGQAPALPHYREVRFEELVADPGTVLAGLCAWLGLEDSPAMLTAHERAAERFAELPEVRDGANGPALRAERMAIHAHTLHRPDPSRSGRWRTLLSDDEIRRFETVAGKTLVELGYPLAGA